MSKKAFDFDEFWASDVYRILAPGNKEYIAAHCRRRYDEYDVEDVGPGTLVGIDTELTRRKITDTDKDSNTFGKRIDDPSDIEGRQRRVFLIKFDKKAVTDFKKLLGTTRLGTTRFYYTYNNKSYEALNPEDFWTKSMVDMYDEVVLNRTKVLIETQKAHPLQDDAE